MSELVARHPDYGVRPDKSNTWVASIIPQAIPKEIDPAVEQWNEQVIRELLRIQLKTGEGCFIAGLHIAAHAFYPDRPLPTARNAWKEAASKHGHLLIPGKMLVAHQKTGQAFQEMYPAHGMQLSGYSLNKRGDFFIGESMQRAFGPPQQQLNSYSSLPTGHLGLPHAELLHQAPEQTTHFVVQDGHKWTEEATQHYYQQSKPPYRPIATFTLQPIS